MRPLSDDQVEEFVHNWYRIVKRGLSRDKNQADVIARENADELLTRLKGPEFRAARVYAMTRNPLLLTNICLVHLDKGSLPDNRATLYDECTDVLLELWKRAIKMETRITAKGGRSVLQPVAYWLHSEEGRTRATAVELAPVIEPALKKVKWSHGTAAEFLEVVRAESGILTGWD